MGFFVVNIPEKNMDSSLSPPTKTERKIVEKNRRNQMKNLYSKLNSLLPPNPSKEALPLPEQIDEAVNYIKSLEMKINKLREKKEGLSGRKRVRRSFAGAETPASLKSPQIEIREMGSALEIVLICGLDSQFIFYEIIRILHEEGIEIVNASFSVAGSSIFHVVHAKIGESMYGFGSGKVSERLKNFVHGTTSGGEIQPELWDFEIQPPQTWGF